jgi:hypothetical protein
VRKVIDELAEEIYERSRDVAAETMPKVRRWLKFFLLMGWSFAWLALLVVGALLGYAPLVAVPAGIVAVTWLGAGVVHWRGRRRLRLLAEQSLLARAQLEGVNVGRRMAGALTAFDLQHRRVQELLKQPGLGGLEAALRIEADVSTARDLVFDLAKAEARLLKEFASLRGSRSVPSVEASRKELKAEIDATTAKADKVAGDVQRLAERLGNLRSLSGSADTAARERSLEDVLEDLDRTASAYREIDDDRIEAMRLRAVRAQAQSGDE